VTSLEAAQMNVPAKWIGALCLTCMLGCASDASRMSGATVTDSAGVTIVENSAPAWNDGESWRVVEPPLVEIGVANGEEPYQLFGVRDVARMSDGRIVVVNEGSQEIRIFDRQGKHLQSLGGQGDGPGEFVNLDYAALLPGDSILAYNRVPVRVALFGPDGSLVRTTQIPYPDEPGFMDLEVVGRLENGPLVMYRSRDYFSVEYEDGLNRFAMALRRLRPWTGELDSIGSVPGTEVMIWHTERGNRLTLLPFGRSPSIAVRGSRIYLTLDNDFSFNVLDSSGSVTRIVRAVADRRPIGQTETEQYVDYLIRLRRYSESDDARVSELRRSVLEMPIPDAFPPLWGLELDALGNVWVGEYTWPRDQSPRYAVFSSEGRMLGQVTLPAGLKRGATSLADPRIDIGADYVLGVWVDDEDVEYVRLYRLDKTSS